MPCALALCAAAHAFDAQPFAISAKLRTDPPAPARLIVSAGIPEDHYLYSDLFKVESSPGTELRLVSGPTPIAKAAIQTEVFTGAVEFVYEIIPDSTSLAVTVHFQGCNDEMCFMPQSIELVAAPESAAGAGARHAGEDTGGRPPLDILDRFEVAASRAGYMDTGEMISFLAQPGGAREKTGGESGGGKQGFGILFLYALGVVLWGLGLNLTPCVLPLIPINIAIIGAGAASKSRGRGMALGLTYGAGMAFAYGAMGAAAVAFGELFGQLNASPWFNGAVAALFLVMAFAMFGAINVDLSRFQGGGESKIFKSGAFVAAFSMGAVSALLAGACVAPAVISVLLFASAQYAAGSREYALLLPFLLGVGMALPWPALGAGIALLPRPGRWMNKVKYAFGVIILGFAVYYGATAYNLAKEKSRPASAAAGLGGGWWMTSLPEALAEAGDSGKPVFIDFWASWCKACLLMDATTFRDLAVREAMAGYVRVKYQAEDPGNPDVNAVLSMFGVRGLPTFVVLRPKTAP